MFTIRRQTSCPVSSLPNELLYEIVSYLPVRNDSKGFVNDIQDVAACSMGSRRMRFIALPSLFRYVVITSHSPLASLSKVPSYLLNQVLRLFFSYIFPDLPSPSASVTLH